jgi:hypothetical protein
MRTHRGQPPGEAAQPAELDGHILRTRYLDGAQRTWGVCECCGFVDELSASTIPGWSVSPLCEACEDDVYKLEAAEAPEHEHKWEEPREGGIRSLIDGFFDTSSLLKQR